VDKNYFGSELYFFKLLFFHDSRDPSQFLGKILTGQNIGKNSLYDADVSSLWKNVEKMVYNSDQWSSPVVSVVFGHSPPTQLIPFLISSLLLYPQNFYGTLIWTWHQKWKKIVQQAQAGAPGFDFVRKKGPLWIHFSLSKPYRSQQRLMPLQKVLDLFLFSLFFPHFGH
jgi:hypothetical protein